MAVHQMRDRAVATITIDRQDALNALDVETQRRLCDELIVARDDDAVRVIVLTGAGERAFSVGADLKRTAPAEHPYVAAWTARDDVATERGAYVRFMNIDRLEIWKPIIASINGYCLGGGLELALQCDLRVAADTASFALPEVKVGSVAGVCGPLLLRAIPAASASKMLLTGARIDAAEALRIGLVSDVWSSASLAERTSELAQAVARNAPLSLYATKRLARETETSSRSMLLNMTEMVFGMIKNTADRIEGRNAFAEKRPPRFQGR
ncbi:MULTISPECIES: enoyl-CoA hydratase-related protein [unclassified Bradyrhizobium]|uniref:enoyl-CoA hydratase/isomerase family protein n=1 Tax=unclassified Bradyrhizobium TaxID=2631580 RepID=UPI002479825B|nr:MULTISPECIES: enoyl-CoA hydratase-related protein [unclassified Bradyrhizobium]WGS17847.1 enoyl-CoA hydratase-related protein [Bradyrhizobium sp. ISRA463]WGS24647.1 enoyl-CoA hydratase-related protein [Bradyrhizobium sp. ISRA464]